VFTDPLNTSLVRVFKLNKCNIPSISFFDFVVIKFASGIAGIKANVGRVELKK
jgi:hypothetical protein